MQGAACGFGPYIIPFSFLCLWLSLSCVHRWVLQSLLARHPGGHIRTCPSVQLRWIAVAVICLSPALRYYLLLHHVDLYTNVFCRLDGLMAGGLIALVVRSDKFLPSRFLRSAWLSLFIAAPLAFVTEAFHARWITYSLSAVASADSEMASGYVNEPMVDVYRDDQLWTVLAPQDPA